MEQRLESRTWHLALGTGNRGQRSVPIAIGTKISAEEGGARQGVWGREGAVGKSFLNDKCRMSNAKCKSGRGVGRSMNGTAA